MALAMSSRLSPEITIADIISKASFVGIIFLSFIFPSASTYFPRSSTVFGCYQGFLSFERARGFFVRLVNENTIFPIF